MLLVDVDGGLALRARASARDREHLVVAGDGSRHRVWLNPQHGGWLTGLAEQFDVVWATGWEHDAPRLLGDLLGVPDFAVLEFTERPSVGVRFSKLGDVRALVGDRPVAWVDDDLGPEVLAWAAARIEPTLLVQPSASEGLRIEHVNELNVFARSLTIDGAARDAPNASNACGTGVEPSDERRDGE
ncbi:hypothetical protein GCM10009853_072800 [Glycomyces scopariae]